MVLMEKEFEDWFCDNFWDFFPKAVFVGRQIKVPGGGILDVLLSEAIPHSDGRDGGIVKLTVVELKKDAIDAPAVTQVLGYMGAIKLSLGDGTFQSCKRDGWNVLVTGLLIGQSMTTEAGFAMAALPAQLDYIQVSAHIKGEHRSEVVIGSGARDQVAKINSSVLVEAYADAIDIALEQGRALDPFDIAAVTPEEMAIDQLISEITP